MWTLDSHQAALIEIIELAYADDDREDALNLFLAALRKHIPFASGALMPVNPDTWQLQTGWLCNCAAENIQRYLDRDYRSDPLIAQGPAHWSLNRVIDWPDPIAGTQTTGKAFGDPAVKKPFHHALSVLCGYRGHPTVLFRLFRTGAQRDFGSGEIAAIAGIAPHLGRCVYLRQLAERPELALPRGFLVMRSEGRLLFQSEGCQRIVGEDRSAMVSLLTHARADGLWFSVHLGLGYRTKPIPFDRGSLLACFDPAFSAATRSESRPALSPPTRAFVLEPIVQRSDLRKRLIGHGLTARELEIGLLVVQGLPYKAIARSLEITEQTVKDHLRSIFKKVGVRSGGALVAQIVGVRHLRFMDPVNETGPTAGTAEKRS